MIEKFRFRCPCCGMIADLGRLNTDRPYKIQVFSQKFGGKVIGDRKGRGKAKGYMKYTDITRLSVDVIREIEEMVKRVYLNIGKKK